MKKSTFYILVAELPALIVGGVFLGQVLDKQGWTRGAGSALCIVVAFFFWIGHLVAVSRKKSND